MGTVSVISGQKTYTWIVGQYGTTVRVGITGDSKTLTLAEVEVYGRTKNPIDGKNPSQSVVWAY